MCIKLTFWLRSFSLIIAVTLVLSSCTGKTQNEGGAQLDPITDSPPPAEPFKRSKAELIKQIEDEFKELLYIRAIKRYEDEITSVIEKRQELRQGLVKEDEITSYWTAASAVRAGLKIPIYHTNNAKTGLVLSNKAKLGLFGPHDLATPTKAIKSALDLKPAVSPLTEQLFPAGQEHYAANLFTTQAVKEYLKKMAQGTIPLPRYTTPAGLRAQGAPTYNEAVIFYTEFDILGIWADSSDDKEALDFQKAMKDKFGADLPLVTYEFKNNNPPNVFNLNNYDVLFSVK